jgi:hypothetical protein
MIGLEYFQFVQLLCNDFNPVIYKNCLIIYHCAYEGGSMTDLGENFNQREIEILYLKKRYNTHKFMQLFSHYFLLLELVNLVCLISSGMEEPRTLGKLVEKIEAESSSIPLFDSFAHLIYKTIITCSKKESEVKNGIVLYRSEFLSTLKTSSTPFKLLEFLGCLLAFIPETAESFKSFEKYISAEEQFFENLNEIVVNDHDVELEE